MSQALLTPGEGHWPPPMRKNPDFYPLWGELPAPSKSTFPVVWGQREVSRKEIFLKKVAARIKSLRFSFLRCHGGKKLSFQNCLD